MKSKCFKYIVPIILSGAFMITSSTVVADSHSGIKQVKSQYCPCCGAKLSAKAKPKPEGPLEKLSHQLQLTDQQQAEVKKIMAASKKDGKPIIRDLEKNQFLFKQALTADKYSQTTIDKLAQAQGDGLAKLMSLDAKTSNEIKSILKGDQIMRFERMQYKFVKIKSQHEK